MQGNPLNIGLCQMSSVFGKPKQNLQKIEDFAKRSMLNVGKHDLGPPDLLVFPELALTGYAVHPSQHAGCAETSNGPQVRALQRIANTYKIGLLCGWVEESTVHEKRIYDSAICIDKNGAVTGRYRKTHLYHPDESHFHPGDTLMPIKFQGIPLGVSICADMRAPEAARSLVVQGAKVLISLTHWLTSNHEERTALLKARAIENFIPVVDVNAAQTLAAGQDVAYGASIAFDGRGNIIAKCREYCDDFVIVTIPLDPPNDEYAESHFQRNPLVYHGLLAGSDTVKEAPYYRYLSRVDSGIESLLDEAMSLFKGVQNGYVGLLDDRGNIVIRHQRAEQGGSFIAITKDQGTAGYAIRTGKTYKWSGNPEDPDDPYFIQSDARVKSELVAPIRVGSGMIGVLLLDSYSIDCFEQETAEFRLQSKADQIGVLLRDAPDDYSIPRQFSPSAVMSIVKDLMGKSILERDALGQTVNKILHCAMEHTGALRGNIALLEGSSLVIHAAMGDELDAFKTIELDSKKTSTIKGWVIRYGKAFYAPNVNGNEAEGWRKIDFYRPTHEDVISELAVPLLDVEGTAIGVLNLESHIEDAFDVELSSPGDGSAIVGGQDYQLLQSLAAIGSQAIELSQIAQGFHMNEAETTQREEKRVSELSILLELASCVFISELGISTPMKNAYGRVLCDGVRTLMLTGRNKLSKEHFSVDSFISHLSSDCSVDESLLRKGFGGSIYSNLKVFRAVVVSLVVGIKAVTESSISELGTGLDGLNAWIRFRFDKRVSDHRPPVRNCGSLNDLCDRLSSIKSLLGISITVQDSGDATDILFLIEQ